jgi:hypothetical protein
MDPGRLVTGLGVMPRAGGGDEVETFHVVGELHVCFDELAAGVDAVVRMILGLHRPGESAPDARLYVAPIWAVLTKQAAFKDRRNRLARQEFGYGEELRMRMEDEP